MTFKSDTSDEVIIMSFLWLPLKLKTFIMTLKMNHLTLLGPSQPIFVCNWVPCLLKKKRLVDSFLGSLNWIYQEKKIITSNFSRSLSLLVFCWNNFYYISTCPYYFCKIFGLFLYPRKTAKLKGNMWVIKMLKIL